jgi:hypothetical protein
MTDSDLTALKKAMAEAHPDRGGTSEAFIEAHGAYVAAKWLRKDEDDNAERRQREEAEAAAAEEERRRRAAAEVMARFGGPAAKAIYACAAVFLVFAAAALYVVLHKKRPVTADARRHGNPAAVSAAPAPQFVPWKWYEADGSGQERDDRPVSSRVAAVAGAGFAVPDRPGARGEKASPDEPRPATAAAPKELAANETDATLRPAAALTGPGRSPTPEQQARSTVLAAMAATNTGSIEDTSRCYADAVTYYGKRMSKTEVIADNMRLWQRWPARNYTIRPDSLTTSCYVIRRGTAWMNCDVKGVFDWEAANSSKRSVGSASITYTLMGPGNSGPLDLRIVDENSTVITRTITEIGNPRAVQATGPG